MRSACKGERYVTQPSWVRVTFFWKLFLPEVVEWVYRLMYMTSPGEHPKEAFGKKLVDYTGAKGLLYPEALQTQELKKD